MAILNKMNLEKNKENNPETKKAKKKQLNKSSLESTFLERPLPKVEDVSRFESLIEKELQIGETDANLSAIYSDNKGKLVDVSKVKKKKRVPIIIFFKRIFVLTIILSAAYSLYYYYFQQPENTGSLNFYINAPERVTLGEEFNYEIIYENNGQIVLDQVMLEVVTPDSSVLIESVPELENYKKLSIGTLMPGEKGSLKIKAYLIAPADSANIFSARLTYIPSNFSSEFRKEASVNTVISNLGLIINIDYLNTALVGRLNDLKFNISSFNSNNDNLNEIYLDINGSNNFQLKKNVNNDLESHSVKTKAPLNKNDNLQSAVKVEEISDFRYLLSEIPRKSDDRFSLPINFSFKEKSEAKEDLTFRLLKKTADSKELIFWEKTLSFDLVNSDLNLELSLNEKKGDQAVNFGDNLNYSLSYVNNGETALFDLVLMVVINGDLVDWSSLVDPLGSSVAGNTMIWTKEDIPALSELAPGKLGKIDFSLRVKDFSLNNISTDNQIISYAQYGLSAAVEAEAEDSRSNTIISPLNSDLSLTEKILYFNEDNLPVGSGPLPPKVGEKTSMRVMWTIKNNLHDLENAEVVMNLAQGLSWDEKANTNVGRILYNEENRSITWRLGYLPLSVYRADAEFNISLTPNEDDRDKILILSSGTTVKAIDAKTKAEINHKTKAKTTKLEDDEIAGLSSNGRVE